MERRRFIGAAAAAASLPYVTDARSDETDGDDGEEVIVADYGISASQYPKRSADMAFLSMSEVVDEDPTVTVKGHAYDTEPGGVTLRVGVSTGTVSTHHSPDEARELARDLMNAADHAEREVVANGD